MYIHRKTATQGCSHRAWCDDKPPSICHRCSPHIPNGHTRLDLDDALLWVPRQDATHLRKVYCDTPAIEGRVMITMASTKKHNRSVLRPCKREHLSNLLHCCRAPDIA